MHCVASHYLTMAVSKCHTCELAVNRQGEKRPGIRCKVCKKDFCNTCAELAVPLCEMMMSAGKDLFTCKECEAKNVDMKAMIDSMQAIKSELGEIKNGHAEQQVEREQVLEGLKVVKEVAKRMERIEDVQEKHEGRLTKNEAAVGKNTRKREEGEERIRRLEEKMENIDQHSSNMRQCNAVAKEVREMEKREKNIVVFNIPESKEKEEEDRRKEDLQKTEGILKELGFEESRPSNLIRIGKTGRFPQQIRVTLQTVEECEKIVKKCRDCPNLANGVFVTRDRTFRERQEAKLFRLEKENEEGDSDVTQPGKRKVGRPRGRPPGRGAYGRGGGGGRGGSAVERGGGADGKGGRTLESDRKRQHSDDDDEGNTRKVGKGGGGGVNGKKTKSATNATPDETRAPRPVSEHPATPRPVLDHELGAVGGRDESF